MEAGGLAPPPPMAGQGNAAGQPMATPTQQQLDKSEREDSGRGLEWFYVFAETGFETLGLETFKADQLTVGTVATKGSGLMVGGGLGVKVFLLTIGARARLGNFADWRVGTLNAEVGLHIPLGSFEPYFLLGGGYAFLGSLNAASWGASEVSVKGYDIRGGAGLDYFVTPVFSIGGLLTGELLGLSRPGVSPAALGAQAGATPLTATQQAAARADGSSLGSALTVSCVLGLHF
jgi:hypothetical protein